MPKPFTPKVITANALLEGDVVYQTATGWTRSLSEAEVLTDEADADLRLIDALSQQELVVGVYLADVAPEAASEVEPDADPESPADDSSSEEEPLTDEPTA